MHNPRMSRESGSSFGMWTCRDGYGFLASSSEIEAAAPVRLSVPTYAPEDDVVAWGHYWPSVFVECGQAGIERKFYKTP